MLATGAPPRRPGGESIPTRFLPRLVRFRQDGRYPVESMMTHYDFGQIDRAPMTPSPEL